MDELLEVDEEELLTFESELIKLLKRTDIVSALPLENRLHRLRKRVMLAVEEESSTSSNATVTPLAALRRDTVLNP